MKNQVKIMINDPEVLRELLKDPEVAVRIKDGVVEDALRRIVKDRVSADLKAAVDRYVRDFVRPSKPNELFASSTCSLCGPKLSDEAKDAVKTLVAHEMRKTAAEAVEDGRARQVDEAVAEYTARIRAAAARLDETVAAEVRRVVAAGFGRLMNPGKEGSK